ncbi:N-alpha-acetyltransferase 20 isoform X1 [Vulpes vulpes]|uniref:N-alpha-acetyltransferase 20 n=3 Tax=Laurasiatheria TaxID=314145 RepID=A0A3Q7TSB8_VULVU
MPLPWLPSNSCPGSSSPSRTAAAARRTISGGTGAGSQGADLGGGGGAMTTLRAFTCDDLFRFNNINLDPLTETVALAAFLSQIAARAKSIKSMFLAGGSTEGKYLAHWPEYFIVAEAPGGELMGYIMGKAEGSVAREEWHGHVTALSVAPEFRRLGLAAKLMELLEEISERKGGFFVDLFVRVSNQVAVNMYKRLGYSVYRTVIEYYSASNGEPDEDAYDMRKALSRDTEKKSIIPLPHPVRPEDIE